MNRKGAKSAKSAKKCVELSDERANFIFVFFASFAFFAPLRFSPVSMKGWV
jgi:hypothetical protein